MGYTYELGPAYSGNARPSAVKDRRPHTAPVTIEPRFDHARDHCRRALKHYRAVDQSAALFDFHVSVKNKNIRPISDRPFCFSAAGPDLIQGLKLPCGFFNYLHFKCGKCDRGNGFCCSKR